MRTNMNRTVMLVLILICIAHATITYTLDIDRSGTTSITVSIDHDGIVILPLPFQADNFRIAGGSYQLSNGTVLISSGNGGFTSFSFDSNVLTAKNGSNWKLSAMPPKGAEIYVYTPIYSTIQDAYPEPSRVSSEDSRTVLELNQTSSFVVYYSLDPIPQTTPNTLPIYVLAGAIIIAAILIALSTFLSSKKKQVQTTYFTETIHPQKEPSLELTNAKKEMMETFNENDKKIVDFLMNNDGKSKRNELERKIDIAKSSLSMALKRLEKRKIVELDRSSTTHFVKLSDYFLKL